MIIEDKRKNVHTLEDVGAGDAFAIRGKIYIKTNQTSGFDENGSYYKYVNLVDGSITDLHEKTKIDSIKVKVVILDADENETKA